jgi:hypothetical protein
VLLSQTLPAGCAVFREVSVNLFEPFHAYGARKGERTLKIVAGLALSKKQTGHLPNLTTNGK